jgi:hypothetical protein
LEGATPASSAPWLTATFQNISGGVQLTLTSVLDVPSEFITEVLFNVNPAIRPSNLAITTDANAPVAPTIRHTRQDVQNGTGGGGLTRGFDILIKWGPPFSNGPNRFNGTDVDTFKFLLPGLTESDFDYANEGGVKMTAKIQGIPGDRSGHIYNTTPVPEPATWIAGALALLPFGASLIRRLRKTPR